MSNPPASRPVKVVCVAHPLVVAHQLVVDAKGGPRASGIRHAGGLDDGHVEPMPATAPTPATPEGVPNRQRHWQSGPIHCEEE